MSRQFPRLSIVLSLLAVVGIGCRPQQPHYLFEDGDLSHYVGVATQIEYPDVQTCSLDDVANELPPFTLDNSKPREIWDLTLQEAIQIALKNGKVMRTGFGAPGAGFVLGAADPGNILRSPDFQATVYDPARRESDARFGVEAALAAFDAQLSANVGWDYFNTPQNVQGFVSAFRPNPFRRDTGSFQAQLAKTNATGGTASLRHNVLYEANNATLAREWPSDWTVNLEAEVRQPFLQGAGVMYNRIAGPGAIPGFNAGVMIARVNTDISLTDFELAVRGMVVDVEKAYWNTYFGYRRLDSVIAGRDSALQTWRQVRAKYELGGRGGGAQEEAQARQQYFTFRGAVETALSELYDREAGLRWMLGIAANDGRLIRPVDEPTTAKVNFDWYEAHSEALVRSPELRRQKWHIKQRELELIAAKNWLLPRLDGVAKYRWLGLGDILIDPDNQPYTSPGPPPLQVPNSAYGSLTSGKYQEWELGLEFRMPLGFRKEMAGVRNAQLNLARERAVLQELELALSNQLSRTFRTLNDKYVISQTHFNRRIAAQREVQAVDAAYQNGTATLDLLLSAQQRKAEAEVQYYQSLVEFNQAIADVHYWKGSLLEYNNIYLAEGPWPGKAYFDARRLARARDASMYLDYGFTRPKVVSRGPIEQNVGEAESFSADGEGAGVPTLAPPMPGDAVPGIRPQAPQATDVPEAPVIVPGSAQRVRPRYDLASLNLSGLAATEAKPQPASAPSPVRPVSYEQVQPPADTKAAKPASEGWKNPKRSDGAHEPVASLPSAEAGPSASGWKGVQR